MAKRLIKSPEFLFAAFLAITEALFSCVKFDFNIKYMGNKVFFGIMAGFVLGVIASLLPKMVAKIVSIVFSAVFAVYLEIQLIYSSVFKNFWSFSATGALADQILGFKNTILESIKKEIIPFILIILLYAFIIFVIIKWADFEIHNWEKYLVFAFSLFAMIVYYVLVISLQGDEKHSPDDLLRNYSSIEMSVQKLGLTETMLRDGIYLVYEKNTTRDREIDTRFDLITEEVNDGEYIVSEVDGTESFEGSGGSEDSGDSDEFYGSDGTKGSGSKNGSGRNIGNDESKDSSDDNKISKPQVLDINLAAIRNITSNQSVIDLTNYINTVQPTYTNEYTGMFEGYNLIFITAEGFDGYMINKELTPTLFKMSHEGFYFTNFYTPLWYGSTLGGEYANLTGLMPKSSGYLSMQKVGAQGNSLPFCLGNELQKKGYYVCAFHNNEYDYYDREISRPYLGYSNYMGIGNGLDYERDEYGTILWPQSDYYMEQNTFSKYCNHTPFHVYYMTVSGHLNYDFNGNAMSERNYDKVADLPYSSHTRAYIACQLEFERMMEKLQSDLEMKGLAENTLIVVCGDHVPYNDMEILGELSPDGNDTFDKYKNTLIIYSAGMTHSERVDKVCYSLDILPTVLNLMGLPYDSRMLVGRDIMSDEPGLVIMHDGSFITDNYRYNAMSGGISENGSYEVSDVELDTKLSVVSNRFRLADAICELDYYSYIEQLER